MILVVSLNGGRLGRVTFTTTETSAVTVPTTVEGLVSMGSNLCTGEFVNINCNEAKCNEDFDTKTS